MEARWVHAWATVKQRKRGRAHDAKGLDVSDNDVVEVAHLLHQRLMEERE